MLHRYTLAAVPIPAVVASFNTTPLLEAATVNSPLPDSIICSPIVVSAFINVELADIDNGLLGSRSALAIDSVAVVVAIIFVYLLFN